MLQVSVDSIDTFIKHSSLNKAWLAQYDIEPTSPLPLFMHANLLKHRERMPASAPDSATSPFAVVKRFSNDLAEERSLDNVRMWVYQSAGMCIELELSLDADGEIIVTEPFPEVYGGKFRNFVSTYQRYGGKDGGW
jgi:alpha 1,2-mannosyltransferase